MLKNLIEETAAAPGTAVNVSLSGAPGNRQTFISAATFANGASCFYGITDGTQSEWGQGTLVSGSPNVLQRTTVLGTTAGGTSRLNFTTTVRVYCEVPAEKLAYVLATGGLSVDALAVTLPFYAGTGGGTANAQTATLAPAITALTAGMRIRFKPNLTNTAAGPTLAVNGLTAKTVKCRDGSTDLPAGALPTSGYCELEYDGTNFRMMFPNLYEPLYCGTSGGTANAQTLTPNQAVGGYYAGLTVRFTAGATNTAAATLNLASLGTKTLKTPMGRDVTAGHLVSGQMYEAVYDGTNFVLQPSNFGASEIVWSGSVSAVSSADFTLPTNFKRFRIGGHLWVSSDGANVSLRTSTNAGVSFDAGASDYVYGAANYAAGGASWSVGQATTTSVTLTGSIDATSGSSNFNFLAEMFAGDGTRFPRISVFGGGTAEVSGSFQTTPLISGVRASATQVNAVRLLASAGNFSGHFTIEGFI